VTPAAASSCAAVGYALDVGARCVRYGRGNRAEVRFCRTRGETPGLRGRALLAMDRHAEATTALALLAEVKRATDLPAAW
jgi:hypothetical protein